LTISIPPSADSVKVSLSFIITRTGIETEIGARSGYRD